MAFPPGVHQGHIDRSQGIVWHMGRALCAGCRKDLDACHCGIRCEFCCERLPENAGRSMMRGGWHLVCAQCYGSKRSKLLKPNVWYWLDEMGRFVECDQEEVT